MVKLQNTPFLVQKPTLKALLPVRTATCGLRFPLNLGVPEINIGKISPSTGVVTEYPVVN